MRESGKMEKRGSLEPGAWSLEPSILFTGRKVPFKVLVGLIYTQPHYKLPKKTTNLTLLQGEFGKNYKKENKKVKRAARIQGRMNSGKAVNSVRNMNSERRNFL